MNLFTYLIKSEYVRAQILAQVRHMVTAGGVALIAKGYADESTVSACAGFLAALVGFWLANQDVKNVEQKITVALATPAPEQSAIMTTQKTVTVLTPASTEEVHAALTSPTPPGLTEIQEKEVTTLLNKLQNVKPGL